MALAVETPARDDMSLRTNDDKLVGARWLRSDLTPVVITAATLTLQADLPATVYDEDGVPLPPPDPERHVIDGTTPHDAAGWVDADNLANGVVLVTIPHTVWVSFGGRTGIWDLIATGEGIDQRCLVRGRFCVEEGVST